jgi:hypothetical protein
MRTVLTTWCLGLMLALMGAVSAQAQLWTEFRPEGGKFYVLMPGTPQTGLQPVPLPDGKSTQLHQGAIEADSVAYVATFVDYPDEIIRRAPPDTHLDNARNGTAKGHKLRSEKRLTIAKHPGREYIVDRSDGLVMKIRSFLVGNRLYQLIVVGNPGVDTLPDTAKFLESFRLLTG